MVRKMPSSTSAQSTGFDRRPDAQREPSNLFLREKSGTRLYWLKRDGRFVVRPLPALDADDPTQWAPMVCDDGGFPWIRRYDVIRALGPEKLSFIVNDPENPDGSWTTDPNTNTNPVWLLIDRIGRAIQAGTQRAEWNYNTRYQRTAERDPNAPWLFLSDTFLMQGVVYENGRSSMRDSFGLGPGQDIPVVEMDSRTGMETLNMLRQMAPDGQHAYGELVVRLDVGGFISFSPMPRDGSKNYDFIPEILWDFKGLKGELLSKYNQVASKVKPWNAAVYTPNVEEQVALICKSKFPASAIIYALEEHYRNAIPGWIYEQARSTHTRVPVAGPAIPPPAVGSMPYIPPSPVMPPRQMASPTVPVTPTAQPVTIVPTLPVPPVTADIPTIPMTQTAAAPMPGLPQIPNLPPVTQMPMQVSAPVGLPVMPSQPVVSPASVNPPTRGVEGIEGQPMHTTADRIRQAQEALSKLRAPKA